jgi:twitching motility protein PilT
MSFADLLFQAKAKKADELMFVVGSEPRAHLTSGWVSLRSSPCLISEWNLMLQTVVNKNQLTTLETLGSVHGEFSIEGNRLGFSLFQSNSILKAYFKLDLDGSKKEISVPQSILDICLRMKGMVLFSGTGDSGQVWALHRILQKMGEEKSFVGVVFSRRPFPQLKEAQANFIYHDGHFGRTEEKDSLLAGVDLVVYEDFGDDRIFEEALGLAERGLFVIYSMKAPSIINAVRRILSVLSERCGTHGASRFAEVLSLLAGQYSAEGLNGEPVYAHEFLVAKPKIRGMLESGDVRSLADVLTNATENSGVLTLNQSLLQLLIRRRLDLKKAFEISRDPEDLDQLLKKVGI